MPRVTQCERLMLFAFALVLSTAGSAGTGDSVGLRWQNILDGNLDQPEMSPTGARLLSDGSLVVAMAMPNDQKLSVATFPAGSQVPSVVPIYLPTGHERVSFDACGSLFVAAAWTFDSPATPNEGDLWLMKFDSQTGRPLWSDPFVWNGPGNVGDLPADLVTDQNGDALLTAYSNGSYTSFRIDGVDGSLKWTSASIPDGRNQRVFSAVDSQGDIYLTAERQAPIMGTHVGAWALDGDTGALVWGPLNFQMVPSVSDEQEPCDIGLDGAGHVVIVSDAGGQMALLRLVAGSGAVSWGPISLGSGQADGLAIDTAGVVFVSGQRSQNPDPERIVLSRDLNSGAPLWGPLAFPLATPLAPTLIAAGNGDLILTAISGNQTVGRQLFSVRIGRDGAFVWGPEYRTGASNRTSLTFLTHDATLVELFVPSQVFSTGPPQIAMRDAVNGQTTQAPQPFVGVVNNASRFANAQTLPDGNLVVASLNSVFPDITTIVRKFNRLDGQVIWNRTFPGVSPRLAIDASGDILSTAGLHLRKLDGASGAEMWGPVSIAEPSAIPRFAGFDALGDVIVVSVSNFFPSSTFLEKRSGSTGALLWGPIAYGGPGNHRAIGLTIDPNGDAFVSVWSTPASTSDWVTLKYSGATGSVLWGPITYDRSGRNDIPVDIEILPGGDVVVVGRADGASGPSEIAAIRYAGSTGGVVWGPVFLQGPVGSSAEAEEIAVDSTGDIFVVGFTRAAAVPQDVLAAKILGGTGGIGWGPVSFDDGPWDLAMGISLLTSEDPVVAYWSRDPDLPGSDAIALLSWASDTGSLRWGPTHHETALGELPFWIGVEGNTIYVAGERELNGSRPEFFNVPTTLVLAYVDSLSITTPPGDLFANCGVEFSEQLEAANISGTATWTIASGALPDGVALSTAGLLSGTPTEIGEFAITVQVQDSTLATATRELTIVVREGQMALVLATPVDDCTWMLSVPGGWTTYSWEPGGETSSTITVSPLNDTIYGVTVGDGSGCTVRGSILVRATRQIDPECDAPRLTSISPTSGPASGGTDVTLTGSGFEAGSEARIDAVPASTAFQDPTTLIATTEAMDPGTLNHALVTNPDLGTAILFDAFFADFLDVDQLHPFHDFVEPLVRAQVTAGCGGGNYCPGDPATREQMAVFLLRSKEGPSYTPPACITPTFNDVPCSSPFAPWIEELVDRLVTSGCGFGNYCPGDAATREQMAVFLLRTLEGPSYTPPDCTVPTFSDVPCSSPFAKWIEELVERGITAGCGGALYCPTQAVSRGQMAVFLTETFDLP